MQATPAAPPLAVRAPLLLPAVAVVFAAWVTAQFPASSMGLLVALGAAGLALGRRVGALLVWLALGAIWAQVRWVGPRQAFLALDSARPVVLTGAVAGCWAADEDGLSAWLDVDHVRQGRELREAAARVRVHLPAETAPPACGGGLSVRGYLRSPRAYRNGVTTEVGSWGLWVKSATLAEITAEPDPLSRAAIAARQRLFPPRAENEAKGLDLESVDGTNRSKRSSLADIQRLERTAARGDRSQIDPSVKRGTRGDLSEVDRLAAQETSGEQRAGLRLARALLLGDGAALPPEQREAMRRVGLAHLVAVSGLNVGMVASVFLLVLLRAPRGLRLAGTLAGVLAYSLLVGPLPSLLRAVLMAAAVLGALLLRRLPAALNGLAVSCLLLVLLDPSWVDDLGFQLSVAATAGLLALAAPLRERFRLLGFFAAPLAVTVAAQLATLPWALASFGRISPISPLANLVAVPWSALALVVALLWAMLRLAIGAGADVLLAVLDLLAQPLAWLETLPASGWITLPLQAPWWAAWTVALLLISSAVLPRPRWSLAARAAAVAAVLWWCSPSPPPAVPELVMLDVGQGDALLLRDGDATLLVDGGGWRRPGFGGRVLLPALAALGVRRLDVLAVTHADRDHCGGAVDLLRELPVGQVWAPPGIGNTDCGAGLQVRGTPYRELAAGDAARVGRWRFRVLGPERDGDGPDNRRSLVLLAETFARRVLLTGDLDAAGEAALLRRWGAPALACDALKVAHHGSPSSTISPFLRAADPRLALISVGSGNAYGHPSPKVLAALERRNVPVLRTDRDGMVRLTFRDPWQLQSTPP